MTEQRIRRRFAPLEQLGDGAQGSVVKAQDHQHDRIVAIKIRQDVGDRAALLREARALLELPPHPNLPLVRDDFFEDGRYHMVMDWIEGEDLGVMLKRNGPFGPSEALAHLTDVATALDHLHTHGIAHADVKPANIIAAPQGRTVLVDLGAAPGTRLGTAGFRAPETARGAPTPAADIFGLAATAFALLTGRAPGEAGAWDALPFPGVIERAIRRAMATDPDVRPHSAAAFIEELRAWTEAGSLGTQNSTVLVAAPLYPTSPDPAWARAEIRLREVVARIAPRHGGAIRADPDEPSSASFPDAASACMCAIELGRAIERERWPSPEPLAVCLGIASAKPADPAARWERADRARSLAEVAHGGQILLDGSAAAAAAKGLPAGIVLRDLGAHRLPDLKPPARIFQLSGDAYPRLRSLEAVPNNLPVLLAGFHGRRAELTELSVLLSSNRLVTITGAGGAGKTRIGLHLSAEVAASFAEGVRWVDVSPLADAAMLPDAIATGMEVSAKGYADPLQAVCSWLDGKRVLLVLDNAEHLADAAAETVERLLTSSADLHVVVTTREPLRIPGEVVWRVPPLGSTAGENEIVADELDPGVRLFLARAAQVQPDIASGPEAIRAAGEICRQLDGMPLAIELAASAAGTMTIQEIKDRLGDRFRLLTTGARTAYPRQRTLRATMDWSYDRLDEHERALFRRLSVFAGGFTLDNAERVCANGGPSVIDVLRRLVEKSLVVAEPGLMGMRYRMLEMVRQYAEEQLEEIGEGPALRARHRDVYVALAEQASPELTRGDQAWWLDALATEHANIRSAIGWCLEDDRDPAGALRIAAAIWRFWWRRKPVEGRRLIERVLEARGADADTTAVASALAGAAVIATDLGDTEAAVRRADESLAVARAEGNERAMVTALLALGNAESDRSDLDRAKQVYEEALGIARRTGHDEAVAGVLGNLGKIAYFHSDYTAAQAYLEESLTMMRRLGNDQAVAVGLTGLGSIARMRGDLALSRDRHGESLDVYRRLGDQGGIAMALNNLANAVLDEGDLAQARTLHEEALTLRRRLGLRQGVAISLLNLSRIARSDGDPAGAIGLAQEAIAISEDTGFRRGLPIGYSQLGEARRMVGDTALATDAFGVGLREAAALVDTETAVMCLIGLSKIAHDEDDDARAATLVGAAESLHVTTGASTESTIGNDLAEHLRMVREGFPAERFVRAHKRGSLMTLADAVHFALGDS